MYLLARQTNLHIIIPLKQFNSLNCVCYKHNIAKFDLPQLCETHKLQCHHRAMKELADQRKAIFVLNILKGLNQARIFKKSVILFWLLNMTI